MKTLRVRILAMTAVAVMAGGFSISAAAQYDYDDRWYVSAFGGLAAMDSDRFDVDDAGIFGVGIGKFLSDDFSLELEFDRIDSDLTPPAGFGSGFNAKAFGLFARYHLMSADDQVRPYFGLGIGGSFRQAFDTDSIPFDKDTNVYVSPVVGLAMNLTDNFGARIQAALRRDVGGDGRNPIGSSYTDYLFTAGITYKFGDPPAPPPPPAKPAPPPPPPPEPVERDDDNDGVKNSRDKCPNTRPGAVVDADGCEVEVVIDLPMVNFAFDSAKLTADSYSTLDDAVATLNRHKNVMIEVAGHTDSKGDESYNLGLSDRRAAAVRDYLISKGIEADRMTSAGYGESRPIATNATDAGRAQNRRTELVITSK